MTVTHIYSHNKEEKERRAMEFCPALLGPQFLWRVSLSCSLRHLWPLTAATTANINMGLPRGLECDSTTGRH